MVDIRKWDAAIICVLLVAAIAAFVTDRSTVDRAALALTAIALIGVAYAVFARPRIGQDDPGWRLLAFVAAAGAALCAAIVVNPALAMLQTIVYPLVWVIVARRRDAIIGSIAIAIAVFFGFAIDGGLTFDALWAGATTAVLSLAFAIAFGLWISSIAEHAEERGRLLGELSAAQDEVTNLSRQRGIAEERERMAREIHDTLAQTLAGMVLLAERAGRQARAGETDAAAATTESLEAVARDALGEARALVARTAAVPSDAAFEASVERLAARFRAESGVAISVAVRGDAAHLTRDAQVVLLRCLQEALANVRKHADAAQVTVVVGVKADGGASLDVSDDGRGFDPRASRTGFGLDGMVDRLALAGGSARAVSAAGAGTTIEVRLPAAEVSA